MAKNNSILIAPLDWGLGHTTRCVPIITYFVRRQWQVILGCELGSSSHSLLKQHFPDLIFTDLRGYRIRYSKYGKVFVFNILLQLPKIISAVLSEHYRLKKIMRQYNIDVVLSDNRFGLYNRDIKSIFMTHQLGILAGTHMGNRMARRMNYFWINKFDYCWIPDFENEPNIAGLLSHPSQMPQIPCYYIGSINRLRAITQASVEEQYKIDYLFLLSGPEPQRSILEKKILAAVERNACSFVIARGLPQSDELITLANGTVINNVSAEALVKLIHNARYVVARSGYTTVMELLDLKAKAIFIPTPGQTEQEYLASILSQHKQAYSFEQSESDIWKALQLADSFPYASNNIPSSDIMASLDKVLEQMRSVAERK